MSGLKTFRNLAFVAMLATFVAATSGKLSAEPGQVCSSWDEDCECNFHPWEWSWSMSCDFSKYENPTERGSDFRNDAAWECMDWCDQPYESHVIQECLWENPWAPEVCDDDCIFTWDSFYCGGGASSEMTCSCNSFNWCMP